MLGQVERSPRQHDDVKSSKPFFDYLLLIMMYVMMLAGVLFIAVATYNPELSADVPLINKIINSSSGRWQAIFTIASPLVLWFVCTIPYEKFKNFSRIFYFAILGLLVIVIGTSAIRSVSGWFRLALGRMLQPSEFAKIAVILILAEVMAENPKPMSTLKDTVHVMGVVALPAFITLMQGETGSVIVMAVIFYTMIYFGGADWKWMVGLAAFAIIGVLILFEYGKTSGSESYKLMRLISFTDPKKYAQSAGLQILNSQEAIGSGGLTGIGLFIVGSHSQLNFVPEDWTDFVFATIGESVGFVGCIAILVMYLMMIFRMLYLARYTYDKYGRLIIIGVMAMLFFHVFQNTAMTVGLMPITGIPLPFLSYGGSNLLTNVIGISLVLNVTKNRATMNSGYTMTVALPKKKKKKKLKLLPNSFRFRGKDLTGEE